jgi:acetoin utilization deacetylase AcuC-like enzyme
VIRFKLDFVADRRDPLGGFDLVKEDFTWATSPLMVIAERHAKGCIVSVSEGRYDLRATLARSPGMSRRRWERETSQLHTADSLSGLDKPVCCFFNRRSTA